MVPEIRVERDRDRVQSHLLSAKNSRQPHPPLESRDRLSLNQVPVFDRLENSYNTIVERFVNQDL